MLADALAAVTRSDARTEVEKVEGPQVKPLLGHGYVVGLTWRGVVRGIAVIYEGRRSRSERRTDECRDDTRESDTSLCENPHPSSQCSAGHDSAPPSPFRKRGSFEQKSRNSKASSDV
jgi:hypothetical protein